MPSLSLDDLWYQWLSGQLPPDVLAGAANTPGAGSAVYTEQSVTAYGSVLGNNASAGAVIASIPSASLPAGKYRVEVYHYVSAAASPVLQDNVEVRKAATPLARIQHQAAVMNSTAYGYSPKMSLVVEVTGAQTISCNFIANFGAAETQTHNVQIVATKVA